MWWCFYFEVWTFHTNLYVTCASTRIHVQCMCKDHTKCIFDDSFFTILHWSISLRYLFMCSFLIWGTAEEYFSVQHFTTEGRLGNTWRHENNGTWKVLSYPYLLHCTIHSHCVSLSFDTWQSLYPIMPLIGIWRGVIKPIFSQVRLFNPPDKNRQSISTTLSQLWVPMARTIWCQNHSTFYVNWKKAVKWSNFRWWNRYLILSGNLKTRSKQFKCKLIGHHRSHTYNVRVHCVHLQCVVYMHTSCKVSSCNFHFSAYTTYATAVETTKRVHHHIARRLQEVKNQR